jgi:hypothetical protein
MIEAFDRLGQRLDQVSAAVAEQVQALQQMRGPLAPSLSPDFVEDTRLNRQIASGTQNPRIPESQGSEIALSGQDGTTAPGTGHGTAALAENARRLVDTLSRSRDDWQAQAADLQQALGAIMDYLENQAAANTTKSDLNEIMSRLRNLEEEQRNLSSQFNTSRWGAS